MPTLRVELFEGRTVEQKRALAKELTEACVRVLGGSADSVEVLFYDIARHDWATWVRTVGQLDAGAGAAWAARAAAMSSKIIGFAPRARAARPGSRGSRAARSGDARPL